MSRPKTLASRPEPEFPVLSRLLWQALALGAILSLALLALPLAPGGAAAFGFLPFWLPAVPAAALLTLHRRFLATAWRAHLVRATPRRRQRFGREGSGKEGSDHIFPRAPARPQAIPMGKCALTPVLRTSVPRARPTNPARPTASAQAA